MIGEKLVDETADCGGFFDHIDDLLDFPVDGVEAGLPPANRGSESTTCSDPVFTGSNSSSDLSAVLFVPYEDIVHLDWLSTFIEDSFSGESLTISKLESPVAESKERTHRQFNVSSLVCVLDNCSPCSGSIDNLYPWSPEPAATKATSCGRARSKRPRPATQILSPGGALGSCILSPKATSEFDNVTEPQPMKIRVSKPPKNEESKKKKIKPPAPLGLTVGSQDLPPGRPARKCLHCEVSSTPQWRAGPMGPKTLCNACGVRYKSGQLFPEYRPAASPTFVPSLHSNSHRKVLDRRSGVEGDATNRFNPKHHRSYR